MSAEIIRLGATRASTVRCPKNGVIFPQVYRVTGYLWDVEDNTFGETSCLLSDDAKMAASDRKAGPSYTLSPEDARGFANAHWEPIHNLDRNVDTGWLIVRHHRNKDFLEGYQNGLQDTRRDWSNRDASIFRTEYGLFTLEHREATPLCPDHLLGYITNLPEEIMGGVMDWAMVVDSFGAEHDIDVFLPADYVDPFTEMRSQGLIS